MALTKEQSAVARRDLDRKYHWNKDYLTDFLMCSGGVG